MIKTFKILNLIFFIAMICVNALANIIPLGHGNTGGISNKYANLFTPAPITFSIWGIIYLLLSLFIIFQFGFFDNEVLANGFIKLIGPWFIISCIMNIGWIFSWHYEEMGISMLIMIGLLLSLIMITTRLTPWNIENATGLTDLTVLAKLSMYAFDIYIGWITAATIANASVFLIDINWDQFGLSDQFWTVIVLIAGALLGILFVVSNRRYMSAAALIWAYCGILIKHISQIGYGGRYPTIIAVTTIGIVAILSTIVIELILNMEAVS